MRALLILILTITPLSGFSQESREMLGQVGNRTSLLVLHTAKNADGSSRLTGEYVLFPALQRRFLEGEASPELGVTTLREGTTPILFGREPTGELRGTLSGGTFKGMRYGPGGQERERFEFSEEFPEMSGYTQSVRCEARDAGYSSSLSYIVEGGTLKSFEWRANVTASGHSCNVLTKQQRPFKGGLQFPAGQCGVTLRDLGDYVRVSAQNCADACGSQAYFEPVLVDKRGSCRLLRPETR